MSNQQKQVVDFFERASSVIGINRAADLHRSMRLGDITPSVRRQVRKVIAASHIVVVGAH